MRVVAFDTETALIRPAQLAPPLVCLTWQERGFEAGIDHHSAVENRLREWLEDPSVLFVGHNAAFDFAVLSERFPALRGLIFKAYDFDRVTDTMIRQQLLDIAAGVYRGRVDAKGKRVVYKYDLESLAKRCAGMVLQKDAWRMSYEAFLHAPMAQWETKAVEVQEEAKLRLAAIDEELASLSKAEKDRAKELGKVREGLVSMIESDPSRCSKYPLDDARATLAVFEAQEKHAEKYLKDQYRQTRAAFGLHLASAWGICVDGEGAAALRKKIEEERDELEADLLAAGLIREDGTRDTKAAKELMVQVCLEQGLTVVRTDAHFEEKLTLKEREEKGLKPRCKKADGTPLDDGSDECEEHVCLDSDACERTDDELLAAYAERTTLTKQLTNDITTLEEGVVYPLHSRYGLAGTGRSTCIAKGTCVQMPCNRAVFPNGKPIEDVRAGDLVYSYSQDGQLHLQRVLSAGRTGYRPVLRVFWRGSGHKHTGELRLTPEHRVMTIDGSWVEAKDLEPGMRLTALSCRPKSNGYYYLYARGGRAVREHLFAQQKIQRHTQVVHHKDHNRINNEPSNLETMSQSVHAALHAAEWTDEERSKRAAVLLRPEVQAAARLNVVKGALHPLWKEIPRATLLRWAATSKGHIRSVMALTGSDYNVLQRKFQAAGIDLLQVRKRYDPSGRYLSKRIVREAAQMNNQRQRLKYLGVGYYRCRELLDFYGLSGNHEVLSIEPAGFEEVYDLEIEHTHSFIAGEICVHNCSKPNIQNQSNRAGFREAFRARPGFVFVQNDYPTLELYTLAQCCLSWFGHSKLAEALRTGDPHLWLASIILKKPLDWCIANKQTPEVKQARKLAKPGNFGFPGGMGIPKFVQSTRKAVIKQEGRAAWEALGLTEDRAKQLRDEWFAAFPEMREYFERVRDLTNTPSKLASVETLFTGRWRGQATYCATSNNGFQALGADCAKNAVWQVAKAQYANPSSPLYNSRTVAFVHDELIVESIDDGRAHDVAMELAKVMCDAANTYLPDIPIPLEKMEPTVMYRWSKQAKQRFDDNGRLIAWDA